ncbi:MAG: DUF411 domain-containing protein [Gemmatimonadaceae bacterium]
MSRRQWFGVAGGGIVTFASAMAYRRFGRDESTTAAATDPTRLTLYSEKECPCCHKWATHLEANGFTVTTVIVADVGVTKDELKVPAALHSCHTAEIGGYIVEGHVPANELRRFLGERSAERGIAVPGMPGGSPGMESDPKVPYEVLAFQADGTTRVFARV